MASKKKSEVQNIDFGYGSAEQFWTEVVLSAYEQFKTAPNKQNAIVASILLWHVLDWIWHEQHPGDDTMQHPGLREFRAKIVKKCPEVGWVSDVADGSKHRGLSRSKEVQRVERKIRVSGPLNTYAPNTMPPNSMRSDVTLTIVLNDGTSHHIADVLSCVINYYRANLFTPNG